MKFNRIALAVLAAATLPAVAQAGVTITPVMAGYHDYAEARDNQANDALNGFELSNGTWYGASVGLELTPSTSVEVEYGLTDTTANRNPNTNTAWISGGNTAAFIKANQNNQARQTQWNGNLLINSDAITKNYLGKFKPYLLLGLGQSNMRVRNAADTSTIASSKDTDGNLGIGAMYRFNPAVALRGELRGIYNFDNSYWEGLAMAGLQLTLGGHLPKAAPVVVPPPPPPVVDGDSDGDGVVNRLDQCPNTPLGVYVDSNGCPVEIVENLKMELRVFFDNAKANIKPQYQPEIAKVAEKLKQFPDASAVIEGHTSHTGGLKFNERLSVARAQSVKNELVNRYGVDGSRLSTVGYGWTRPIAPNNTKEGQAMNRRVYAVFTGNKTAVKMKTPQNSPAP